jgi:hypothetical protein
MVPDSAPGGWGRKGGYFFPNCFKLGTCSRRFWGGLPRVLYLWQLHCPLRLRMGFLQLLQMMAMALSPSWRVELTISTITQYNITVNNLNTKTRNHPPVGGWFLVEVVAT